MAVATLPAVVRAWARGEGASTPAAIWDGGELSYGEWSRDAIALARALERNGLAAGDTLGLLAPNRVEWLVVALAGMEAGARVAPLNTWVRRWEMEQYLADVAPSVLVLTPRFGRHDYLDSLRDLVPEAWEGPPGSWVSQRFPRLRQLITIGNDEGAPAGVLPLRTLLEERAPLASTSIETDEIALILYTSGSTARPKAVPLLQGASIENALEAGRRMGLRAADRVWLPVPFSWSYGSVNALMTVAAAGAALVLQDRFEAGAALDLIEGTEATMAYLLPPITEALIAHPGFATKRLRTLRGGVTIGSPRDVERVVEVLGIPEITNVYGATETYGTACATFPNDPAEVRMHGQGLPLPGVEVRIWNAERSCVCKAGEIGEIHVRGRVTPGYLVDAEAGTLARPEGSFTADGFFRLGDLGSLDADGRLHFFARGRDVVRVGEINVSPAEVEAFLLGGVGVRDAAVVGVTAPDARRGDVLVGFVVPEEQDDGFVDDLLRFCRENLASYKVPFRLIPTEFIPRTEVGKLCREALVARAEAELARGPIASTDKERTGWTSR